MNMTLTFQQGKYFKFLNRKRSSLSGILCGKICILYHYFICNIGQFRNLLAITKCMVVTFKHLFVGTANGIYELNLKLASVYSWITISYYHWMFPKGNYSGLALFTNSKIPFILPLVLYRCYFFLHASVLHDPVVGLTFPNAIPIPLLSGFSISHSGQFSWVTLSRIWF